MMCFFPAKLELQSSGLNGEVTIKGLQANRFLIMKSNGQVSLSVSSNFKVFRKSSTVERYYTFCCSLPENILSFKPTSNSLPQKYIHFIQLTFISADTQPFASKDIP